MIAEKPKLVKNRDHQTKYDDGISVQALSSKSSSDGSHNRHDRQLVSVESNRKKLFDLKLFSPIHFVWSAMVLIDQY